MWNAAVAGKRIAQRSLLRAAPLFTVLLPLRSMQRKLADALQISSRRPWFAILPSLSISSSRRFGPRHVAD